MVRIGETNRLIQVVIELFPVGPKAITAGMGILGLVGESTRGPCNESVWLGSYVGARKIFHSGDLKEASELGFQNGVPAICAIGVKGAGNAKASVTLTDGLSEPSTVGAFYAKYEGIWGNAITVKLTRSSHKMNLVVTDMAGDGTAGPYYLEQHGLLNYASNWVKVNGTELDIVYAVEDLMAGSVYLDTTNGSLTFFASEAPDTTDQISCSLKYTALRLVVTDNETTETYDHIRDLIDLEARLTNQSYLIDFVPEEYETHFPSVGTGTATHALAGGSDGAAITVDDWNTAMYALFGEVSRRAGGATCYAFTSCEVETGTGDLIPEIDGFATYIENKFKPGICYVGLPPNTDKDDALDIASNYNSRNLSIVVNPWDTSSPRQNGAVALAARRAAASMGESCAKDEYALKGMNDLLNEFEDEDVDVLDEGRLNVLTKKVGILPYLDRGTASDEQFWRSVDNVTVNWVEVCAKIIADSYKHWKNTPQNRQALRASVAAVLDELKRRQILRVYTLDVLSDLENGGVNRNKVWINIGMEPIGHMEQFWYEIGVGVILGAEE